MLIERGDAWDRIKDRTNTVIATKYQWGKQYEINRRNGRRLVTTEPYSYLKKQKEEER